MRETAEICWYAASTLAALAVLLTAALTIYSVLLAAFGKDNNNLLHWCGSLKPQTNGEPK